MYIYIYYNINYTGGLDFTQGRYNATFTSGTTTATVNISILLTGNSKEIKQFRLRLFIDGAVYQQCIFSGSVYKATVSIIPAAGIYINTKSCPVS